MNIKYLFLVMIICLSSANLMAQNELKGIIVTEENQPIEGAYVYNLKSKSHAHTNEIGQFNLTETKISDSLTIGLLGYEKTSVVVSANDFKNSLTITLSSKTFMLDELVLSQQLDALNTLVSVDLETSPVNNSQQLLQKVPGLFIGQHAGGGKAEQIFLRGFDVDHGTDVALSVDGMPVNMVSHAHGQGYSDLHFIIPETIKNINFGKGPYYANKGDFNTAGYVAFKTENSLESNQISISGGQFNTTRLLGMFNVLKNKNDQNAYVAIEHLASDGPFESPQNFNRLNIFGKYSAVVDDNNKIAVTASHFTSSWDASGQIPERSVRSGLISRFGAIDDTEGGFTSRTNFNVQHSGRVDENTTVKSNVFYSYYDFKLFSNFTFFLEDAVNGDQIKQQEQRDVFGFNTRFKTNTFLGTKEVAFNYGTGLRYDVNNDVELSRTLNRKETLENIQLGDVKQSNSYAFIDAEIDLGKFQITPGLRLDYFKFQYNDRLQETYQSKSDTELAVLPKLNILFNQNDNLQWFVKSGIGFHSNDSRVVINNEATKSLPKAYGVDFGLIAKPTQNLVVNATLWYLYLQQEFVYVGDAGVVEPSGRTERSGIDLGLRYQISDYLYANTDATFTRARGTEDAENPSYIPLAPDFTLTGALSLNKWKNWSGSLKYRWLGDRPANEDYTVTAEGYFITDLNVNYHFNNKLSLGVMVENIFDTEWNETQFLTESRLQNEVNPVEEIHFTPGTPLFIKAQITYKF